MGSEIFTAKDAREIASRPMCSEEFFQDAIRQIKKAAERAEFSVDIFCKSNEAIGLQKALEADPYCFKTELKNERCLVSVKVSWSY